MSTALIRQILLNDLDPDFVEAVSIALGWGYADLYERLANDPSLVDGYREEEFNRRRGDCAVRALAGAARRYGVPFDFRRLDCNGQRKLLVKAARVILIQEPILTPTDHPSAADYKRRLADVHGYVRQLELDLGDQPLRIRDWSGCVLAVLLHGPAGMRFTEEHKALGTVMLGVPDAAYEHWVMRLDLQEIAMFGRGEIKDEAREKGHEIQTDNVVVTPKRKNSAEGAA